MSEMIVQVRNKMLRRIGGVNHFVSHNKDYTIQFQFDESWNNVRTKMAVFAYEDGEYGSEIFDGDTCKVPELPREGRILIGVKAGEDLSTELLCIPVCKSADDVITDEYDEPDPKIYEQILDIINNLWNGGTTVYPSPVKFLASPSAAKVGDLIRVKEVDENGEIKETEAVDVEKELVVVNITEDTDGVLHADMTYDEINPLRYTHAVYAKWASGMYPYSTSARMYFGEDLKNVFVFSSSMAGMENWRIAIAQDGSVKINSYKLELVGRKVQIIDETTGTGDDSEKNYPSAKAVYDAIGKKIDAPQTAQVGEVLTVEEVDAEGKPKKWKTAPAAAEQKQADWAQNDPTAADYVKNRTHYSEYGESMLHGWSGYYASVNNKYSVPIPIVVIRGNRFEDVPCTNNNGVVTYRPGNYSITANFINSTLTVVELPNYTTISEEDVVFPVYQTVYHKIPENYIPDTIARANQIVKPDWNVVVESAPDAILNKPVIGLELIKGKTSNSGPTIILPSFNIPPRISGAILVIQELTIVDYEDGDYIYFTALSGSISGDLIQGNNLIIRMYTNPNYNEAVAIPIVSKFGNDFVSPLLGMGIPHNFNKNAKFMLSCKGNKTIKCREYGFYAV